MAIWIFTSCQTDSKKETESETKAETPATRIDMNSAQLKSAGIETGKLEKRVISKVVKVTGHIEVPPQNLVSISVPLGGYLKSTKLLTGMHLQKGEIIAVMEDPQYIQLQQEYLTTKANLEKAALDLERQKVLNESKASSDKVLQQAQADFKMLQISLRALGEKLKIININPEKLNEKNLSGSINLYAPFDGFVSAVKANIGKYISPTDVLFDLVDPSDIHLNLSVFEKDLLQLSIGQKIYAYTNSNPNRKHLCEIILISKDISPNRSAEVHCHFEAYDKTLLPGMYMNAEIELSNAPCFSVPEKAVVQFEGKHYVFVKAGKGSFEMKMIETGERENAWVEIRNGETFQNNDIVFNGAYALLMGLKNTEEE